MSQPLGPQTALALGFGLQTVPQARQFRVLPSNLTHAPSHRVKPSSQSMLQPVALHTAAPSGIDGQALPQPRQWAGSLAVSTHAPSQLVVPLAHDEAHFPALHTSPVEHGLAQPPQLA